MLLHSVKTVLGRGGKVGLLRLGFRQLYVRCIAGICRSLNKPNYVALGRPTYISTFSSRQRTSVLRAVDIPDGPTNPNAKPSSFHDLKLSAPLVSALETLGIVQPTDIQALAIPAIMQGGNDYVVGSQTGSGKTLAYLLPLIEMLKQQEALGTRSKPKRPRVLILGPTQELTEQISSVAKSLAHHVRFSITCLNASTRMPQQRKALAAPVDMVIATPQRYLQHLEEDNMFPGDVQWLVVDEADTMLLKDFGDDLREVLKPLKLKSSGPAQVVMVSASMTKDVRKVLTAALPGARPLESHSLHRPVTGTRHAFMIQPPGRDKMDMLLELLSTDLRRKKRVLVFCNTIGSCRAVEHHCAENNVPTVCYHGDMPVTLRQQSLDQFAGVVQEREEGGELLQPVMVATDLAARGLDFRVEHVINFDFPLNSIDYLHRTGRTARAGNPGSVTSLVNSKERLLAGRIEWTLEHELPLDKVSGDPLRPSPWKTWPKPAGPGGRRENVGPRGGPGRAADRSPARPSGMGRPGAGAGRGVGAAGRGAGRPGPGGGRGGAPGSSWSRPPSGPGGRGPRPSGGPASGGGGGGGGRPGWGPGGKGIKLRDIRRK